MKTDLSFKNIKSDFPASIVVWLVALPLCLGIAKGSDADPFAGIIAGIIGGIIVTIFSGSKFGVSGPAAGLITIVVAGIADLGYEQFLLAIVLAGVIQFLMGLFRLGVVGYFVPTSVINGMLASIGFILILKQLPVMIGVDTTSDVYNAVYHGVNKQEAHLLTKVFLDMKAAFMNPAIGAIIIFGISLGIMILWEQGFMKKRKWLQYLPGSLMVVIAGALINYLFNNMGGEFGANAALDSAQLVQLPPALETGQYGDLLVMPDFTGFGTSGVYVYAITIALVASIETLLSVEATDKLDPDKNISPTNKELKAQGIGNVISGLIGGLPITMVIVRSSANINAKAKSKMSSILHGFLLLISVFAFPSLMETIPLASLAAILIVLGWKLLKVKQVIKAIKIDKQSALVILVTVASVVAFDLLKGVGIGFALAMFFILRKNYELAFITTTSENETIISFSQIVSFLNKGGLMQTLQKIPDGSTVRMSAHRCHTMSSEIIDVIKDFIEMNADKHNIKVELIGFDKFGIHGHQVEKKKAIEPNEPDTPE